MTDQSELFATEKQMLESSFDELGMSDVSAPPVIVTKGRHIFLGETTLRWLNALDEIDRLKEEVVGTNKIIDLIIAKHAD